MNYIFSSFLHHHRHRSNATNESISEEKTNITKTVMEESTVSEILEDGIDTAIMSVFDADKATTVNDSKEDTTQNLNLEILNP